ncbi:ATP-binding protein [Wenjunlia tyrosinilytica]|uniref:Histidine kinase/HSP90-like ATPase domain-containing protein n=1 Tax=Wenjunlia tyrosinilytica TaxID=1544741 RepID=A0A917ZFE2_9ACTN|nr:ATP-binding protein [Wenjunlia tyrosinilytica]GGO80934.1 hypothetical protein GCM10012280_04020 [Wenjunlia tyrosinilytica]
MSPQITPAGDWARSWTYPSAASSVPRCRHAVLDHLRAHGILADTADRAALLVTELAGNAVEHADSRPRGAFTVVVVRRGRWLRIEVRDVGRPLTAQPRHHPPELTATGGRGLFLVQTLSGSWGVRPTAAGKVVWCQLAC